MCFFKRGLWVAVLQTLRDLHEIDKAKFHTSCVPPKEIKPFIVNQKEEEVLEGSS